MINRLQGPRTGDESGFTLVELLVVIAILGILSAVVVMAVGGIGDRGQDSACEIDTRTLRTAEEANFSQARAYAAEPALVPKFLSKESTLHNIVLADDPLTTTVTEDYYVTVADDGVGKCGAGGPVGSGDNK